MRALQRSIPKITPLTVPSINWEHFVRHSFDVLGRSPTAMIDASPTMTAGDTLSFIASLGEFRHENTEPWSFVRDSGSVLRHLHSSFLCETTEDVYLGVLENHGDLAILPSSVKGFFIISGDMLTWRDVVASCCSKRLAPELRLFFNCLLTLFDKAGLAEIWKLWSRETLPDQTFILTRR